MQPVMSFGFDHVYKQVVRFPSKFYCTLSIKEQTYTPFHDHKKGQFIYIINDTLRGLNVCESYKKEFVAKMHIN